MSIDSKLYRIFVEAGKRSFPSRRELATHVAKQRFEDFSYVRRSRREYSNWQAVLGYVSLLVNMEMLNSELKPYISAKVTMAGFGKSLADKATQFAEKVGFSLESIDSKIKDQISQRPAILPTPFGIYDALDPKCSCRTFYRVIRLRCLEDDRYGLRVRNRPIVATKRTIELGGAD